MMILMIEKEEKMISETKKHLKRIREKKEENKNNRL